MQAERMVAPGVELLVAATTDGVVPALVLGLGGIWTELLADVVVIPLPASPARIERAMSTLRGAPLLRGGAWRARRSICRRRAGWPRGWESCCWSPVRS